MVASAAVLLEGASAWRALWQKGADERGMDSRVLTLWASNKLPIVYPGGKLALPSAGKGLNCSWLEKEKALLSS